MKIKDLILTTIIILFIELGTIQVIETNYIQSIAPYLIAFYVLTYMILAIRHEKRLESELHDIQCKHKKLNIELQNAERTFAAQVQATDDAEKERDKWKEKYKQLTSAYDEPFATDSHKETNIKVCPQCGVEMTRHTDKIYFCDNIECPRKQWHINKL